MRSPVAAKVSVSEAKLQAKLNNEGIVSPENLPEPSSCGDSWNAKIRVIQRIEELAAELRREAIGESEGLGQIEVQVHIIGASNHADAGIAKDLVRHEADLPGVRCQRHERIGIEVSID